MALNVTDSIVPTLSKATYWRSISNEALIAMMLGVLASVIAYPSLSISHINGEVACLFFDYGALGFGGAAVIAGLAAMFTGLEGRDFPSLSIGALALLVGLFRVAYGAGFVFSPCG